mgnify:FL=1|jgi:hypothetical protein
MANTRRENRLEELGRVDAEKAHTRKGKRNLRDEKYRIRHELKDGGRLDNLKMNKKGQPLTKHIKMAKGGHVKSRGKALRGGGAEIK